MIFDYFKYKINKKIKEKLDSVTKTRKMVMVVARIEYTSN